MADAANTQVAEMIFGFFEPALTRMANELASDGAAAMTRAREHFAQIAPGLPYLDEPQHPMAPPLFSSACALALYLAVRDEDTFDVHRLGAAFYQMFADMPLPAETLNTAMLEAAKQSHASPGKGEFVFDITGSEGDTKWGMNITSCAISALFARYDAMDFVPYMCAVDDVFSEKGGSGLRRTGTIALGASHCDFRYDADGEPLHLAGQFPDRIKLSDHA